MSQTHSELYMLHIVVFVNDTITTMTVCMYVRLCSLFQHLGMCATLPPTSLPMMQALQHYQSVPHYDQLHALCS